MSETKAVAMTLDQRVRAMEEAQRTLGLRFVYAHAFLAEEVVD